MEELRAVQVSKTRDKLRCGIQLADVDTDGRAFEQDEIAVHKCRNAARRIQLRVFFLFLRVRRTVIQLQSIVGMRLGQQQMDRKAGVFRVIVEFEHEYASWIRLANTSGR